MIQVTASEECEVWVSQINRPFEVLSPFCGDDFALMLVIADPTIATVERAAVSTEIVRQGCRYAVCTGYECSQWDDSIDYAFLATSPNFSPPDDRFVMTTWHEGESLEEVTEWFRWSTTFQDFVPRRFLVLLLGGDRSMVDTVDAAVEKWFGPLQ